MCYCSQREAAVLSVPLASRKWRLLRRGRRPGGAASSCDAFSGDSRIFPWRYAAPRPRRLFFGELPYLFFLLCLFKKIFLLLAIIYQIRQYWRSKCDAVSCSKWASSQPDIPGVYLSFVFVVVVVIVVVIVVVFTLNRSFYPTTSAVPPVSFLILHPRYE